MRYPPATWKCSGRLGARQHDQAQVNERQDNIGARRLHTVLERLVDTLSFESPDRDGSEVAIDRTYVDAHLNELVKDPDLSRYIL